MVDIEMLPTIRRVCAGLRRKQHPDCCGDHSSRCDGAEDADSAFRQDAGQPAHQIQKELPVLLGALSCVAGQSPKETSYLAVQAAIRCQPARLFHLLMLQAEIVRRPDELFRRLERPELAAIGASAPVNRSAPATDRRGGRLRTD